MFRLWKRLVLCLVAVLYLFPFPICAADDLGAKCPDYSFLAMDGKTVTPATTAGRTTLIVFVHMNSIHGDSGEVIRSLANAEWIGNPNLSVLVVDWMGSATAEVEQFAQTYAEGNTDITFCTEESSSFHLFLEAFDLADKPFSLPMSFVVDKKGNPKSYMMGESSEFAFRNLLQEFVEGIDPVPMQTLSVSGENGYTEAFEILKLLNIQRRQNGLSPLKMDRELLDAAMLRAAECMLYYSHTRPNGSRCFTVLSSESGSLGENIAIGQETAEEVMTAWMNSPGHRANILDEDYASVGIGVFYHNGVYSWTQMFSSNPAEEAEPRENADSTAKIEAQHIRLVPRLEQTLLMLQENSTKSVTLSFVNKEFDLQYVHPDSEALTFHSSDPQVATVDEKGVVKAIAAGTAQITVALTGTDKTATVAVEVTEHNYQEIIYKTPTCSYAGEAQYTCLDCGNQTTRELPKQTAHIWDDGVLISKPTTEAGGEKRYTCTHCGETKTEGIPKYPTPEPVPTQPATITVTEVPALTVTGIPTAAPTKPTAAPTEAPTKPTAAPTAPETKAPTVATMIPVTIAPTLPATQPVTEKATVLPTQPPTEKATVPPTQPPTEKATVPPTQPLTEKVTILPTKPTDILTEPTELPTEPTKTPTDPTQSATVPTGETTSDQETKPTLPPETQPVEAATQAPIAPDNQPGEAPDNKLTLGILVAAAAALSAACFLVFWKQKK